MKTHRGIWVVLMAILLLVGTVSATNISNGLIGYWPMDTITYGKIVDTSGYGNNGTVHGAINFWSHNIMTYDKNMDVNHDGWTINQI